MCMLSNLGQNLLVFVKTSPQYLIETFKFKSLL